MSPTPTHHLPPPLRKLLAPLLSQEPAAQLIRSTARQQWRLLAVNPGSSVVEALSEGGTLAVVFLAVEVLAAPEDSRFNRSTHPLLGLWPEAASWLNSLPATALFISLLALAVLLQALQSLSRLANSVSVGTFAAECRARVTARIPSQGPEAIRVQIVQCGWGEAANGASPTPAPPARAAAKPCWGYGESTKKTQGTMTPTECNPQSNPERQSIAEPFTYWRETDGHFLGYLNAYPDHWTQGDDLEDLKAQLLDLYQEFSKEDLPGIRKVGELVVA